MLLLNDNIVFVGRLSNIMLQNVQVMIICYFKVLFLQYILNFLACYAKICRFLSIKFCR